MTDYPAPALSFDEATAYLATLREFTPTDAAPGSRREERNGFRALLETIGNPHERLLCLHIAGTNGKGSTVTFLASALKAAGYRVGAYLSPFVWDVRERWQMDGALISPDELARQVSALRPVVEELARTGAGQITEFELKTAVAFRWFAQEAVDFAVLEVGIGGRLDSTNVIPAPLVSVITSIGWDHQALLGDTLAKIAGEKAGIIKRGTLACVTSVTDPEPLGVISGTATAQDVPLHVITAADVAEASRLSLTLRGAFQHRNAACAIAALRVLHEHGVATIPGADLRRGIESATLPGRFEVRRYSGVPVVLDVAHNADAARVLAESLTQEFGAGKRATLVVGMSRGHEPGDFLSALSPLTRRVVATAPTFRPKPAAEIAEAAMQLNLPVTVQKNVEESLKEGITQVVKEGDGYVVVTGSFYTVGDTQ